MYRKGVRSMPRCFKKELVKLYPEAFNSIEGIKPLVGPDFTIQKENRIVDLLTRIPGLPSFWLITSTNSDYQGSFWVVFESKLNNRVEDRLHRLQRHHICVLGCLNYHSKSEYYAIY